MVMNIARWAGIFWLYKAFGGFSTRDNFHYITVTVTILCDDEKSASKQIECTRQHVNTHHPARLYMNQQIRRKYVQFNRPNRLIFCWVRFCQTKIYKWRDSALSTKEEWHFVLCLHMHAIWRVMQCVDFESKHWTPAQPYNWQFIDNELILHKQLNPVYYN